MSLFESYQEEFKEISKDVLRDLDAEGDHAAKSKLLRQADKMLTQLGALVKQMEIEARSQVRAIYFELLRILLASNELCRKNRL